ncbi:hypothetical protein OSC52_13475 [Clostridium pasteurianum]|uniref:hypothetical protein n=1 Tax=Clostridium pasteurianum TaxID=1501 RepID=UPI0022609501|nr:hypothetical protein [Clostridium pasteurianum]UZW12859.1 hypothetical protein OSC52_13475 [Clostridium pasteurianum]
MKKILVERVEEFTDNIKEYEVITQEEAIKIIGNFNIAETIVDKSLYDYGYTIEINLETGEIYAFIDDGRYRLGDTTTIRNIYYNKPYCDFSPISETIINEYDEFQEFSKQYKDWKNEIEREYDYEFDSEYYRDEYEAFIVEVLEEDIDEFTRTYNIEILENEIDIYCDIYEDVNNFYYEAKVIEEL